MRRTILLLSFIVFLGAVLRLYNLGSIPNSLNWDEVSWGYNAYSILTTGKDEYGQILPLSFRAFNDFKQPVYVYSATIPIELFGLTPFAVRLPSALFGILTIPALYFLARNIFHSHEKKEWIALLAALSFALSPWSIQFSRVAFEANVALFFTVMGSGLFVFGAQKKNIYILLLALTVLSISSFTYHSAKIFTPLLTATLFIVYFRYFLSTKKTFVVLAIFYLLLNSIWIFDMRTTARGRSVIFTSNQTELLSPTLKYQLEDEGALVPINKFLYNRRVIYAKKYVQNYISNFDPNYLFVTGDNARHHAPGMGVLYLALLPVIFVGFLNLVKAREREKWIVFAWIVLAPLAASLAIDSPNASRSLVALPPWDILAGLGLSAIFVALRKRKVVLLLVFLVLLGNVIYYLGQYFLLTNIKTAPYWQYGYKEAVEYAIENPNESVFFDKKFEQPYIFYLFYSKYNPKKYIQENGSYRTENKCYKIENAYFGECEIESGSTVILPKENSKSSAGDIIVYPDGTNAAIIYKDTTEE